MNQMNQMNQMNNLGMGVIANGVGSAGPSAPGNPQNAANGGTAQKPKADEKQLLNTYIYDYFIKNDMIDVARALLQEETVEIITIPNSRRGSPRQKHDPDGNPSHGLDDSMDTDRKEDIEGINRRGDDLPLAKVPTDCPHGSFLYDWWSLFWDIFGARSQKPASHAASAYINSTQSAQRQRQEYQQRMLLSGMNPQQQALLAAGNGQGMMNQGYPNQMIRMPNGTIMGADGGPMMGTDLKGPSNLVRQAMQNNSMTNQNRKPFPPNATPQQIAQMNKQQQQQQQQMMQQQMQRDQSVEGDMNGMARPQSPVPGGQAAPSPSKRPRVEGEFQPGAGRGQPNMQTTPAGAQASQMLLSHGINPNSLSQQQFMQFQTSNPQVQQKSIQAYTANLVHHQRNALQQGIPKAGMPNGQLVSAPHGTPMMHQTSADGGPGMNNMDFYNGGGGGGAPLSRGVSANGGNHALQDYQLQLMLLEQQNKKRLMMARAEQDSIQLRGPEAPRPDGSVGFQSMSPSGNRAAPSPQPTPDMKRGTPKMGTQPGPGSPLPDGISRGSPAASMTFNGQAPTDPQLFYDPMTNMNMMSNQVNMPNGAANNMRPPSSHPAFAAQLGPHMAEQMMNPAMRQQQAERGQPNMWQQQPHGVQGQPSAAQQAQQQMAALQQAAAQQQQQQQAQQQQVQQQQQQGQPVGQSPANAPGQPPAGPNGRPNGNPMPPPQAPPVANGRTQPSSPQVANAQPPTPTQTKANPRGGKKEPKEPRKGSRPNKKGAAAAAASGAATPSEPLTPTTPVHPNSFTPNAGGKAQPNFPGNVSASANANPNAPVRQPTPEAAPAAAPAPMPPSNELVSFASIEGEGFSFGDLDNTDTIFDFDSFLNTDDNGASGPLNFDPNMFLTTEGVEAGGDA